MKKPHLFHLFELLLQVGDYVEENHSINIGHEYKPTVDWNPYHITSTEKKEYQEAVETLSSEIARELCENRTSHDTVDSTEKNPSQPAPSKTG
jgi:hypothetical protein